jgi:hypothetical protein
LPFQKTYQYRFIDESLQVWSTNRGPLRVQRPASAEIREKTVSYAFDKLTNLFRKTQKKKDLEDRLKQREVQKN